MTDTYGDGYKFRYCDHPMPGSIIRLPDIPELVRGPTLVLLPSGKEIHVPRMGRLDVQAKADVHDQVSGNKKLENLLKLI